MPTIPKLNWRHGRNSKPQKGILGSSQPSSNTVASSNTLGNWNSHVSLGTSQPSSSTVASSNTLGSWNSHVNLGNHGTPEREPLQRVPESVETYRVPAELEARRGDTSWTTVSAAQLPHYIQRDVQQQRVAEEEQMAQAFKVSNFVAHRKERADAEKRILERQRNASADNVRRLRELIRERYALDLYVWGKRNVQRANRKRIEPKCKKADAILQEIYFIVNEWDEDLFDKEEWQMVKRIKAGLSTKQLENGESGEPAIWGDLAPWDRQDETEAMARLRVA